MNILVLNGSPRPQGETAKMIAAFREADFVAFLGISHTRPDTGSQTRLEPCVRHTLIEIINVKIMPKNPF